MPVYNLEDYIAHAMDSIFSQTLKDIEIICVNDGSSDSSLEVLRNYEEKYDFIKVFSQENKGAGPALNKCIDEASGEYVAFLDADDIYVDNDALEKMYEYAVENNADMVAGNLKFVEEDYSIKDADHYKRELYKLATKKEVISPDEYGIPYAFYKNIFRREFLNQNNIRFPPYKRGVDTLFLARSLVNVKEIYMIPVWLYGYNYGVGGGFNRKLSDYDFIRNFFKVFKGVFDVFNEAGFDKVNHEFKNELMLYLNFADNSKDYGIYEVLLEVFGDDGSYFEDYKKEYDVFVAKQLLNHLVDNPTSELYEETTESLDKLDLPRNSKVSNDLLRRLYVLKSSEDVNQFLEGILKIDYMTLETKYDKLVKKNKKLKKENSQLQKKYKKSKKFNDELLSSSSWKLTKPLRAFKRVVKK